MKAFSRFLAQTEPDGTATKLLEKLVQRVCEAVVLQDRRDALQQLRDLLVANTKEEALLAFGSVGVPAMLQVVTDREDLEMVQLALESLAASVAVASGGNTTSSQAVAINAQHLARSPDALPLLLGLLEGGPAGVPDFYARYHTLQVLKGLALAAPRQLQDAILGAPLGMTRLMDLLGEQEVLRNEALLLLGQLAAGSADLQQIAAFEGGFDRLFGIIREEGWLDGDIVVQDCLQLLEALLRGSPPNQLMFRDAGFLAQLPALLRLPDPTNSSSSNGGGGNGGSTQHHAELPPQKAANLVAAMDVVLALLPPAAAPPSQAPAVCAASHAANRQALMQRGLLDALLALALQRGGAPDESVRAQALLCLAALVSGSPEQQGQLAAAMVTLASSSSGGGGGVEGVPLLQAALQVALCSCSAPEQVAADRLIEAYCSGNPAGQAALAGSLTQAAAATTPAAAGSSSSFGGRLLHHLGRQGGPLELAASSRAAAALSHLVAGSPAMKSQLLSLQLQLQPGVAQQQQQQQQQVAAAVPGGVSSVMVLCASHLGQLVTQQQRQPGSVEAAAALLRLLLLWLHGCPPAVTAFLRAVAQTQPFLVDSVRGSNACSGSAPSNNPATRGMLALLLGECAAYAQDAAGTPSQQQLLDAIDRQIGQQQYLVTLDGLAPHLAAAGGGGGGTTGSSSSSSSSSGSSIFGEEPSLSPAFAAFLTSLAAEVRQRVTGTAAPMQVLFAAAQHSAPSTLQQYVQQQQQQQQVAPPAPPPSAAAASGTRAGPPAPASPHGAPYSPAAAAAAAKAPPLLLNPHSSAAAAAAASPRLRGSSWLPPVPSSPASSSSVQLQEAVAAVEALQRDNQHLREELAAVTDRLHQSGGSSVANGHLAPHAAAAAAEAAAEAEGLRRQLAEAQAAAERAAGDLAAAQEAARKLETDLEDLSAAYSALDGHADLLQQQVDRLQAELAAERQRAGGGSGPARSGEVEQRIAAARQEAEQAAEEGMVDLLVCLGQEEAKVARLRARLEASGVDCEALLADIVTVGGEEDLT